MKRAIYAELRTFEKYDDKHFMVYLYREIIPDCTPEVMG